MVSVDVVIPCYNYGRYLRQCVDSVQRQAGVEWRVLILDDASSDNTPEIAAELARTDRRVTFRRHTVNAGHISTYNEGIEWSAGDYFLLLSADDYLLAGALGRAAALMQRSPDIGLLFGRAFMLGEGSLPERVRPFGERFAPAGDLVMSGQRFIELSGARNIVPTPTAVVRGDLQKAVGGYRHDLPHSGDMEMWLRLAARASVGYVDADQAVYRWHAANMSRDYSSLADLEQRQIAIERFVGENGQYLPDAARLREKLMLDLAKQAVGRASMAFNDGNSTASGRLLELARSLHPDIANSAAWWRLRLKRRIGSRVWSGVRHALRPN